MMYTWLFSAAWMAALWGIGRKKQNASLADFGWASALGCTAIGYAIFFHGDPVRRSLLAVMGAGWAFRLAYHFYVHRFRQPKEDGRYSALRHIWGEKSEVRFFLLFQAKALLVPIFSIPFFVVASEKGPLDWIWIALAVGLWLVSVVGETQADLELMQFKSKPENAGKVCEIGFWKYSRHPNYFFDWLHWWSYFFLTMGSTNIAIAFVGPLIVFLFLFYITGMPGAEAQAVRARGGEYVAYQRRTSAFFPWSPKDSL
jgi:steroid 5-alpha reductase family enzyme